MKYDKKCGKKPMTNFSNLAPIWQTLILSLMTCTLTMLGASMVFFFKTINKKIISILLSVSAGVMLASALFSLLIPAINQSEQLYGNNFVVPTIGFAVGGLFVIVVDIFLEKVLKNNEKMQNLSKKRSFMLISAITFHNIPEGMCIGVAVMSSKLGLDGGVVTAIMLAVGIGLQNFPEGASVSLPMRSEGMSRAKAFWWGAFSGFVEPVFACLACLTANLSTQILPFLLALSSGAMISVACTELIAESAKENKNLTTLFVIIGFCIMMILDLAL